MVHPLADSMYDHDQKQGQLHGRQVQDELNQTQPSPNTNIDELLSQNFYWKLDKDGNKTIHLDHKKAKTQLQALLTAAYEQGYDTRTLEADHELEDAVTAAKIEELNRMPNHTSINLYVRDRIKELEKS